LREKVQRIRSRLPYSGTKALRNYNTFACIDPRKEPFNGPAKKFKPAGKEL